LQSRVVHVGHDAAYSDAFALDIVFVADHAAVHVDDAERLVVELLGNVALDTAVERDGRVIVEFGHAARVVFEHNAAEHAELQRVVDRAERQQQGQVSAKMLRG
jgi:hypothetical protein